MNNRDSAGHGKPCLFWKLEPYEGKLSRTVLRGVGSGDASCLLDRLGAGHKFYGPNNATDVWPIKKVNPQSMIHLTEKPVELAVRAIQYSSLTGENVLDLFGGSGSTLIGCEQTGRKAFLMELDEPYCDVIRQRWAEFVHGEGCDWKKLTPAVKAQEARKCVRASRKVKR